MLRLQDKYRGKQIRVGFFLFKISFIHSSIHRVRSTTEHKDNNCIINKINHTETKLKRYYHHLLSFSLELYYSRLHIFPSNGYSDSRLHNTICWAHLYSCHVTVLSFWSGINLLQSSIALSRFLLLWEAFTFFSQSLLLRNMFLAKQLSIDLHFPRYPWLQLLRKSHKFKFMFSHPNVFKHYLRWECI